MTWRELGGLVAPHYPKDGNALPPIELDRMLRIYLLQQWFNLSDPAAGEALYDSATMHPFAGIDLRREAVLDETTLFKFRHLLETHEPGAAVFAVIGEHLQARGNVIGTGTIVDATIIGALSWTGNAGQARDPATHQTKKVNQRYFAMKAHVGVDSRIEVIHSVAATATIVNGGAVLGDLLHGVVRRALSDRADQGKGAAIRAATPRAKHFTHRRCRRKGETDAVEKARNTTKSRMRVKVGHSIGVVKRVFGFSSVRYRGLAKNTHHLFVTAGLANFSMCRGRVAGGMTAKLRPSDVPRHPPTFRQGPQAGAPPSNIVRSPSTRSGALICPSSGVA